MTLNLKPRRILSSTSESTKDPDVPQGVRNFVWFFKNWKKYWKALLGYAVFIIFLVLMTQIGIGYVKDIIREHFSSVMAKVARFNFLTGDIDLVFVNDTSSSIPIDIAYITVAPTNAAARKPLPPEFINQLSAFDKFALLIPGGGAVEFGPYSDNTQPPGRPLRMAVVLVHDTSPVILHPGITLTNMSPTRDVFAQICKLYPDDTVLELILHLSLIDSRGRSRLTEILLGNYSIGEHHTSLENKPYPMEIDVLRKAKYGGKTSEKHIYNFSGTQSIPMLDKYRVAILENAGDTEGLLRIGDDISRLVPVVFLLKSLRFGCQFTVDLNTNDSIPPDLSSWILSRDMGNTVMNISMAFSDNWSTAHFSQITGQECRIFLPSNQWQILTVGHNWANIMEGVVSYKIDEHAWLKLIPANETTPSIINAEYNRITKQNIESDPTWTKLTNSACLTNYQTYLLVNLEIAPDLSMISQLVITNGSNRISNNETGL